MIFFISSIGNSSDNGYTIEHPAMFSVFFIVCLFGGALAQETLAPMCPEVETVKDFDVARYMGRWFEVRKYFMLAELGARCIEANYSGGDNNTVIMENSYKSIFGATTSVRAVARTPDVTEPAKLKIKYDGMPADREGDYWVLGTDYDTYAVVYSCKETTFRGAKHAWILARERRPADSVIDKAMEVAEKNKLHKALFLKTRQTNCD